MEPASRTREISFEWLDPCRLPVVLSDFPARVTAMERKHIDVPYDKAAYERVRIMRNKEACEEYMSKAPLGTMKPQVQNFMDHLDRMNGTLRLTLVVSQISWGNCWNEDDNIVTVTFNGAVVIQASQVSSRKHSTSINLGQHVFSSKLSDYAVVTVRVMDPNPWPWGNRLQCFGEAKRSIKDFHNYEIEGPGQDGSSCKVAFQLMGIPIEPPLPQWSESQ